MCVLAAYAFFASAGEFDFPRVTDWKFSRYASLAEGFRLGHLYLEDVPDERLMELPYPWDPQARKKIYYHWDVSFYNGRYYLYFTALPVLLVYLPFRMLLATYPADTLVAAILATWAFLAMVIFARRALSEHRPAIPFPIWILLIGLGNVVPYALIKPQMYEISILSGTAMTAMWALALLAFHRHPSPSRTTWLSIWLALSIAARPNLGVLLFVSGAIVARAAWNARRSLWKWALAFFAPLAITAALMVWYNVARFHRPFEFGHRYQLTEVSMEGRRVCSLCSFPELRRLTNHTVHYLFWPPLTERGFPFVDARPADLDPAVSYPTPGNATEPVVGILPLVPLTGVGMILTVFLALRRGGNRESVPSVLLLISGIVILLGVASCWWVVARYTLDFMLLIVTSSVVLIEVALGRLRERAVRLVALQIATIALSIYSIALGVLLGFGGPGHAFRARNPELFAKIAEWMS